MKNFKLFAVLFALATVLAAKDVFAGPPFVNLEGVGGVAYNPLAYVADSGADGDHYKLGGVDISAPRFGSWYVHLGDSKIDWTSFGVATAVAKRFEFSYGYQTIAWVAHPTFHKNNFGFKALILPENSFDTKFIPAISAGTIYKTTSSSAIHALGLPLRTSGEDYYLVATKTITALPQPVILSGGLLSSEEFVTGVLGFLNQRRQTGFANIDVVWPHNIVTGYEFKQGEQYSGAFKNANYWDAHVAWLANKNLTLIAAFTDTSSYTKPLNTRQGLGRGFVLSSQYAF
jgi:Protein of unknown function (DUF3034)